MHDNPILGARRERGRISCPDRRGRAGSGIGSTCAGRVRVTHDPVSIRPVAIPRYNVSLPLELVYKKSNWYIKMGNSTYL